MINLIKQYFKEVIIKEKDDWIFIDAFTPIYEHPFIDKQMYKVFVINIIDNKFNGIKSNTPNASNSTDYKIYTDDNYIHINDKFMKYITNYITQERIKNFLDAS